VIKATSWSGRDWTITVTESGIIASLPLRTVTIPNQDATTIDVRRRWFRTTLRQRGKVLADLRGISKSGARDLKQAVQHLAFRPAIDSAVEWHSQVCKQLKDAEANQRWFSTEAIDNLLATRPKERLIDRVRAAGVEPILTAAECEAANFLDVDLDLFVVQTNEAFAVAELTNRREFYDAIEKTPLTEEQARAVVCFDNRVQVLAAAGSGKTSVMVARAAYAVSRGFVRPDRILLLAFNKAAATELQERIEARFASAGINSSGLRASTFHSFGLDVIGRATGGKPRLAPWLEHDEDIRMLLRIVDGLRDSSEAFRYQWDLYRLLFANAPCSLEDHGPDGYRREAREGGYRTFGGDVVKSHGERLIADFLYLNGVNYEYERSYSFETADSFHSQYRPDFYYPDIDAWHEHWAFDRDGEPPASFEGYTEGVSWKRSLHLKYKTSLIETTWAEVMYSDGLGRLGDELTRLGLNLDWNPDRRPRDDWAKPMKHENLARLVRTFMTHVKSNSWTKHDLDSRLATEQRQLSGYRTRLFLDVYWAIHAEWERHLSADGSVDFEDMLVQAADHLEAGRVDCCYDLVMVDEFQDASRARARLVRGLMNKPGRYLLAVGDDWQAINRFAGADLSVMTDFERWFGRSRQLMLTTSFRCSQRICDTASGFVSKNPSQFRKPMRSFQMSAGAPITILRANDPGAAVAAYLEELSAAVNSGSVTKGTAGTVSVIVLGRFQSDRDVFPPRRPANLDVSFRTVHSSKGLEADYVVLPKMTTGAYGFPSNIADDPVLDLAMPDPELFPHAEERRLLYVALTRARRAVTLITPPQRMSPFLVELIKDPNVIVAGGVENPVEICPRCEKGITVPRRGPHEVFIGCSTFPTCNYIRVSEK
jgi:DNA helicase-4